MTARSYAFKVGSVECIALLDGRSLLGIERFMKRYPEATEAEYRQAFADIGLSLDDAESSLNPLVAKIGGETILIDTGEGGKPNGGHILESMKLAGISPDDITRVIITHADGDHVKGALTDDNQPVYPNSTYIISKTEMDFWQGRIDNGIVEQQPIVDMMRSKGLRLIEMDEQIMPGVTAVPIPGHKPGQIAVLIESEGEKLIHMADLLHSPMQFAHPEWSASFDVDTSVSVPTRREALALAADQNLLAMFYHLPFPGLGRVKHAARGFTWHPIQSV